MTEKPLCETVSDDLFKRFAAEMDELRKGAAIGMVLNPLDAWVVLGLLQVALSHPETPDNTREVGERVARSLQEAVAPDGALAEVAELGWRNG